MRVIRNITLLFVVFSAVACSVRKEGALEKITFHPSTDFVHNAANIEPQEEDIIGRAVAAKILSAYGVVDAETVNIYINSVGQAVAAASSRPETYSGYSFAMLDSPEVNAMAAPGGYIFITKGFLRLLPDEDSLAAVLAHEVAHVIKRHGLLAIKPGHFADYLQVGEALASSLDCTGLSQQFILAFSGAVNDVFDKLIAAGYSRDQELEADQEAISILKRAGYNPGALKVALAILENKKSKGGWFKTHPSPQDRLSAVSDTISSSELPGKSNTASDVRKKRFRNATSPLS